MATCRRPSRLVMAVTAILACISSARDGAAQVRRYQPRTPTVSPYLNLTRPNFGGLPNYYAFVRPQIQQERVNLQQRALINQQQGEITRLQNEVREGIVPAPITGTSSWFMIPGSQARFLDTTGYFPEPVLSGGRR